MYDNILTSASCAVGKGAIQLGSSVATTIEQVAYMLVAMANHVLRSAIVVCFNAEAKEGDRGRVAVLDKVWLSRVNSSKDE